MSTIYNSIDANKRKTWVLVIVFSIFTVLLIAILGISAGLDTTSSLIFGFIFAVTYSLISFYVSDKAALAVAGAKEVNKDKAPDLYRIVENLSITAGIPTPKVYIIDDPSPNAFATGRDPEHASIAFTTGILAALNKQEIEGVTAHELSHIKNFDIRIMTIVVVLVGMIILMSDILLRFGAHSGMKKSKDNVAIVILIAGIILGILSPLIAQVIKLSVSRTREYLADQSGAILTRYPEGLASALEKIRDSGTKLQRANHATAHLYISSPFGANKNGDKTSFFQRLFLTHPPINERIKKLRGFDV